MNELINFFHTFSNGYMHNLVTTSKHVLGINQQSLTIVINLAENLNLFKNIRYHTWQRVQYPTSISKHNLTSHISSDMPYPPFPSISTTLTHICKPCIHKYQPLLINILHSTHDSHPHPYCPYPTLSLSHQEQVQAAP